MTSQKKAAANQANGRKGRGPRTVQGKLRSSRNALRHGLSTVHRHHPKFAKEIYRLASAICEGAHKPPWFTEALTIAECEVVLTCIDRERVGLIERVREADAVGLNRRDGLLAQAKARFRSIQSAGEESDWIAAKRAAAKDGTGAQFCLPRPPRWEPVGERDDLDAMREARRDLTRLDRYERRARSRRHKAIRALIAIKSSRS